MGKIVHDSCKNLFPFYCSGKIYVFSLKNIRYNIKWKAISFDKSGGSHYNENV